MVEKLFEKNAKCQKLRVFLPFYLLLFTFYLSMPVYAFDFDTSVDDNIRKNYNPSKLEDDMALPVLPKIIDIETVESTKSIQPVSKKQNINKDIHQNPKAISNVVPKNAQMINPVSIPSWTERNYAVLKKGTKFRLRLVSAVSDRSIVGDPISLVSVYPTTTTYFTIPMGTTFKGKVVKSHGPQFTGNGGLIVLNIDSIILGNQLQPINANVSRANFKHIFFNSIKGKRRYVKSMFVSMRPGTDFFRKMLRVTVNLANDGSSIVLAPFSVAAGAVAVSGNVFISPVLALFHKGDPIALKPGCSVDAKLLQDVFVYY